MRAESGFREHRRVGRNTTTPVWKLRRCGLAVRLGIRFGRLAGVESSGKIESVFGKLDVVINNVCLRSNVTTPSGSDGAAFRRTASASLSLTAHFGTIPTQCLASMDVATAAAATNTDITSQTSTPAPEYLPYVDG